MSVCLSVDVALGGFRSESVIVTPSEPLCSNVPSLFHEMLSSIRLNWNAALSSRVSPSTTVTFSSDEVVEIAKRAGNPINNV